MFKKISLVFVLALLMSGFFVKPVEARAMVVGVPARIEWVDSGVYVQVGETYHLRARGRAITGPLREYPDAISGPAGQITICYDGALPGEVCVLDNVPFGALIGKIGVSGAPFLIGGSSSILPSSSGQLYLAVNDFTGRYYDNRAGFIVIFR